MAEWLYEDGIGEQRAALVADGDIIAARIVWDSDGPRAGAVIPGRLAERHAGGRRGLVRFEDGGEALLEPIPPGVAEGAALRVEIIREAIPEAGRPKPARARFTEEPARAAPTLLEEIRASGLPVRPLLPHQPDALEAAGWSELLAEAMTGEIPFPGGALRLSPTPAMALFDVDGGLPPADLARAGAMAAARAITRLDIGGSIGIDLPTVANKAERQAVAEIIDAILPRPFERTGVNGFGFLQIVRRRARASLPERLRADPAGAAARALLRRAERTPGAGERMLVAAPQVIAAIAPEWVEQLAARLGAPIALRAEPGRPISDAHVQPAHP